ncbi:hypothetical protein ACFS07_35915 [Undibacterium arcticum]
MYEGDDGGIGARIAWSKRFYFIRNDNFFEAGMPFVESQFLIACPRNFFGYLRCCWRYGRSRFLISSDAFISSTFFLQHSCPAEVDPGVGWYKGHVETDVGRFFSICLGMGAGATAVMCGASSSTVNAACAEVDSTAVMAIAKKNVRFILGSCIEIRRPFPTLEMLRKTKK